MPSLLDKLSNNAADLGLIENIVADDSGVTRMNEGSKIPSQSSIVGSTLWAACGLERKNPEGVCSAWARGEASPEDADTHRE